jgi:hypothetical protein
MQNPESNTPIFQLTTKKAVNRAYETYKIYATKSDSERMKNKYLMKLLRKCKSLGEADFACTLFSDLEKHNITLTEELMERFLRIATDAHHTKLMIKLLNVWGENILSNEHPEEMTLLFLKGFHTVSNFHMITRVYAIGTQKVPPTNRILSLLINLCREYRALERVEHLWMDAMKRNVLINDAVYTQFFMASIELCRRPLMESIIENFSRFPLENLPSIASLMIQQCGLQHEPGAILDVYTDYRKLETPSVIVFGSMITACRKVNKPQYVTRFVDDLLLPQMHTVPVVVGSFIQAVYEAYDATAAIRILQEAKKGTIQVDIFGYSNLINTLVDNSRIDLAFETMFVAEKNGHTISPHMMTKLIAVCGYQNAIKKGRLLHEKCKKLNLCTPGVQIALMRMYAICGSPEEAQEVIDECEKLDTITSDVWSAMMEVYGRTKQENKLYKIFKMVEKQDAIIDYGKIHALHLLGKSEEALQEYHKLPIPDTKYINRTLLMLVARIYAEMDEPELAEKELRKYENLVKPNVHTLLTIMKAYGPGAIDDAQRVFKMLNSLVPYHKEAHELLHGMFIEAEMKKERQNMENIMRENTEQGKWDLFPYRRVNKYNSAGL